jgi:hypothetical protein
MCKNESSKQGLLIIWPVLIVTLNKKIASPAIFFFYEYQPIFYLVIEDNQSSYAVFLIRVQIKLRSRSNLMVNILVIHGNTHKGRAYDVTMEFLKELKRRVEKERFLK